MRLASRFLALALCVALYAADKPVSKPVEKDVPRTELHTLVVPGAALKFNFPELTVDRRGSLTAGNLKLPANYDKAKSYPLVVWLGGGEGGNTPDGSFLPAGDFITVGLPYPKGANKPAQANMVGDYAKVWTYQRFILDEIAKVIQNIDKSRSIIVRLRPYRRQRPQSGVNVGYKSASLCIVAISILTVGDDWQLLVHKGAESLPAFSASASTYYPGCRLLDQLQRAKQGSTVGHLDSL